MRKEYVVTPVGAGMWLVSVFVDQLPGWVRLTGAVTGVALIAFGVGAYAYELWRAGRFKGYVRRLRAIFKPSEPKFPADYVPIVEAHRIVLKMVNAGIIDAWKKAGHLSLEQWAQGVIEDAVVPQQRLLRSGGRSSPEQLAQDAIEDAARARERKLRLFDRIHKERVVLTSFEDAARKAGGSSVASKAVGAATNVYVLRAEVEAVVAELNANA